jgi:tRNA nucleotidyltransferase (CCA-adding enzyme)
VEVPAPSALLDRVRDLDAAAPLRDRLGELPSVYLVGGAVRDLLTDRAPPDLDLVVAGDPGPLIELIAGELREYDRFGTATVSLAGHTYDIARARRERYPAPGALPEVEPAGIDEDLERRDFTVNGLAIELGGPAAGAVRAVRHALEDLEGRRLRVLHDGSFIDDPTRLLRLARYSGRLGFSIDRRTRALAEEAIAAAALETVTGPRIGSELRLLARDADPLKAFAALHELGLDAALGLRPVEGDLPRRALALLPVDGDRAAVVLALATTGTARDDLIDKLDGLGFEAGARASIVAAATGSEALAAALSHAETASEIAAAVGNLGPEAVAIAGALGPERQAREWLGRLRDVRLEIDGRDLLAAGLPEGPAIGRGLRAAWAAKLDGRAEGRAEELAEALRAGRVRSG